MYVVSAKITCFPLKLSSSQSNYQHGHCGISETSGVFDEERSSYFLRAPSASGAPINTCKPRSYMYVVSARITCLPLKLSPSQSYYQHGYYDTSESRGVFDEERSSYFLHVPSASGAPFNTCKPRSYMYVVSAKITCLPLKLSSSHSYYQHGHCGTLETRGVFDEERSSYFLHVPSASGAPFNTCNPPQLYVRCECKNNLFSLKVVSFSKLLSTRSR
jgi:hypothetical protein